MEQLFPNFIEDSSSEGLRTRMAEVSLKRGGTVNFFSVYFDTNTKKHIAWYHDKPENILADQYSKIKATNENRPKK